MDYVIICFVALIGSGLTLFSGFGLGTLLLPVFGLFFPIEIAIVMTALVHFMNNIFKFIIYGKLANKNIVLKFGIPAIIFAYLGANVLSYISSSTSLYSFSISQTQFEITVLKIVVGILLIAFSLFDFIPKFKNLQFEPKFLSLGGALSGFFGGLSGHQGALRSAFLVRVGLSKEAFVATGVVIACLIDITRLSIYLPKLISKQIDLNYTLIFFATLSAFVGVYFGNKLLQKTTIKTIQNIVALLLLVYGVLMIFGII
jgi:uncharacterized protein